MPEWKTSPVIGMFAVVVMIACIVVAVILLQPKKTPTLLMCEKCNTQFEMELARNVQFPIACPKCQAKTAFPAKKVQCLKCGWTGVIIERAVELKPLTPDEQAKLTDEQRLARQKGAEGVVCPKCGSGEIKTILGEGK